jgi:hypothetical protein
MEKQQIDNEFIMSKEIVPLEQARFLDKLEPVYEQQWEDLLKGAAEAGVQVGKLAGQIWRDESFPRAIRDRALLLSIGKVSKSVSKWRGFISKGDWHDGSSGVSDKEPEFMQWLNEALTYGDLINHHYLFHLSYDYFTRGDWSQGQFEEVLELLNPDEVQPEFGGDMTDSYDLDRDRLPFIHDILNNVTVKESNTKLKEWAQEKDNLYRDNLVINEEILPTWLRDLPYRKIQKVVEEEYRKHQHDEVLPPAVVGAYKKYWIGFYNGLDMGQYEFNYTGTSIIKHLGEFPKKYVYVYLKARYQRALRSGELSSDEEHEILSYIDRPLDEELIKYAEQLDKKRAEQSEEHAKWLAKEKEDRASREAKSAADAARKAIIRKHQKAARSKYEQTQEAMRSIFANSNEEREL